MASDVPTLKHCCQRMSAELNKTCPDHPRRSDCPDALVAYRPSTREYGLLVHDGGSSMIGIDYCPWCGASLGTA